MAILLTGTTIGGHSAIHAGNLATHGIITTSNIGSYAITSIPTSFSSITVTSSFNTASNDVYASMRVIRNDSAITDGMYIGYGNSGSGITRIFGGGSTGGALEKYATYTVEPGSFRAPIFYDSDNTTYYFDGNSTTSLRTRGSWRSDSSDWDGEYAGKIQYHSNHWYFQSGNLWLFRNAGGANVFQVDQSGNGTFNGDIYLGTRGTWLSSYLNQDVRTSASPSFASIYLNGTQLTGTQTQQLKNTLDITGLPYKCDIVINGDPDTFYPVHFIWGNQDVWRRIIINRGYSEQAPWDPIGTGAHHGGLLLDWEGNFGGWGGAEYSDRLRVFNQSYTDVCADMYIYTHSMGYVFMLRGGGTTGALYHIYSDQEIRGYNQVGTPDIAYNTSTLFYDHSIVGYRVYAPAPLTLAQINSSRIDGLRTKKQSLLDNRYLRQGVDISGIGTVTATNFLANNAFYLNGQSYYLNSYNGGIYTNARFESASTIHASGGNSSNWSTAYGWGNHASAGYITSSALSSYLPLSGGTISGNLTINGTWQTNISTAGGWSKLSFTASNAWGDGTTYGVLGASGGNEPGVMVYNMHATWAGSSSGAGIRMGRSGGVSSGAWYQVATMDSDEFMIAKNGSWSNGGLKITSDGLLRYANTGYRYIWENGTWGINISGNAATANSATTASSVPWSGITGKPSGSTGLVQYGDFVNYPTFAGKTVTMHPSVIKTLLWGGNGTRYTVTDSYTGTYPQSGSTWVRTYELIDGSNSVYSSGNIYCGFWNNCPPTNITVRVQNTSGTWYGPYQGSNIGVGYFEYWRIPCGGPNFIKKWEITFTPTSGCNVALMTVDIVIDNDEGIDQTPLVGRGGSSMYGNLSFVGSGNTTNLTLNTSGVIVFPNTSNAGLSNSAGDAGFRLDDIYGNIYTWNTSGGYYVDANSYYFRSTGASNWMTINSGTVQASADFRAPIFYDSNDTNYYGDFAGTSRLNNLYLEGGVASIYNASGYSSAAIEVRERNFGGAQDDTWATAPRIGFHWGGRVASQIALASNGRIHILNDPGTANEAFQAGIIYSSGYGDSTQWKTAYDWGNHASAGYLTSLPSHNHDDRYYTESESDSRYIDFTSNQNVTGIKYFLTNNGYYSGSTDSAKLQVYATGANAAFMSFHRGGNYAVNFGLDGDNVMRIGGWSAAADRWVLDMSGNNTVAGSFRAPIFYDSANTNFYGDFASTSVMNSIRFGTSTNNATLSGASTWGVTLTTDAGWIQFGPANGSWAHIYASQSFYFNQDLYVNGNVVITSATIGSQSVSYASTAGSADQIDGRGFVNTGSNNATYADSINSNGISYVAFNISLLGQTDGALYSQAYDSAWQHQIYGDYRTGQIVVRGKLNGTWQAWRTVIDSSTIGSQSVSYATTAGTANAVAWGNVSSKPSLVMYYQGFTLDANTMDGNSTGFTYSVNAPYTGPIARFSETGYSLQLNAAYSGGGTGIAFRTRNGDAGSFNPWRVLLNDANYTSYSPSLTGSGASGTWGINVTGSAGSVAWTNVSSRPTNLSQFTNDLGNYGGFLTSITAHTHAISDVSGLQTALDGKQAAGSYLTTSGKAADSELFDGTDSIYFVKGNGTNALGRTTTNLNGTNSAQGLSSGFYDGTGMSNMPTSDWYHLIVNSHYNSATTNQYEFQLATAFWDKSNFYVRSISPGDVGPWRTLIHNGNIGSQSVSYASTAGSATSATTATTATVASQLNKFGDIYGQDWNSYYIQDKLIAAAVYGHSGANRPNLTYDYGVMLSYGETSGPVMQMYFPENSPNIGTIFRKATYRTGWNGNWSTWKTLVEQEGNTCTIVGGNQTGMEIHANVGYNQDPLTYFLLRGQADTSWKALKIRLTGDAGGQDIEFRRIAENGADARMFYVPRGANQVIFEYQFVQGSDSRLKDNIIPITNSLDKVKSLRGVEFDWNSGVNEGTHDVGLIAQEVEAVLPEAVTTQEDGYKNLAYTKVIPLLVEAMKEQQAMIDALKAEIELLKNK